MANKIAFKYNIIPLLLNSLKTGISCKTEVDNESKTVLGRSMKFRFGNERLATQLPDTQKNSLFLMSR